MLNPKKLLLDLIKYRNTPREWDLKTIYLIGGQNSGKSNLIRYIVKMIRSIPDYNVIHPVSKKSILGVIRTNDLRIIGDPRYSEYFRYKKVLVIIFDDIITEGFDSRRAMEDSAVENSRAFCITRHTLEENYEKNGIIFLIFATQSFYRLDPTIRDTVQLKVFTMYYDQKFFTRLFTPQERELIRISTYEGMFSSYFDARRFCICRTLTGDTATLEIPFMDKSDPDVQFPFITRDLSKDALVDKLVKYLREDFRFCMDDFTKSEIRGFLEQKGAVLEDKYSVKLKATDYNKAMNRASFLNKVDILKNQNQINPNVRTDNEILVLHDTFNWSFQEISDFLKIAKSTAHQRYMKCKKEFLANINITFEQNPDIERKENSIEMIIALTAKELQKYVKPHILYDCNLEELRDFIKKYIDPNVYDNREEILDSLTENVFYFLRKLKDVLEKKESEMIKL